MYFPLYQPAILIKLKSDDGLIEARGNIQLGKKYLVDINSKCELRLYNMEFKEEHTKEVLTTSEGGWVPTELIKILFN